MYHMHVALVQSKTTLTFGHTRDSCRKVLCLNHLITITTSRLGLYWPFILLYSRGTSRNYATGVEAKGHWSDCCTWHAGSENRLNQMINVHFHMHFRWTAYSDFQSTPVSWMSCNGPSIHPVSLCFPSECLLGLWEMRGHFIFSVAEA